MEFCGGCHVANTADIGVFVIESESSIAAGVRRIQGRSSIGGYKLLKEKEEALMAVCNSIGCSNPKEALQKTKDLLAKLGEMSKTLESMKDKLSHQNANEVLKDFEEFKGYKLLCKHFENQSMENINSIGDELKVKFPDYILCLVGGSDGELPIAIFVGGKALENNKAGDLVREVAKVLGGGGGGRPNMANGKGRLLSKLPEAIEVLKGLIK